MKLQFTNRKVIDPIDFEDPTEAKEIWLKEDMFNQTERKQILNIFKVHNPNIPPEKIFSGDFDFFHENYTGMAECPIEWWDISDNDGNILYQIWLYGDSGVVYKLGTGIEVVRMTQWYYLHDVEPNFAKALVEAQNESVKEFPDCELKEFDFCQSDEE